MLVSVLRQGDFLIASIHTALDDDEMVRRGKRSGTHFTHWLNTTRMRA